jgi:hypothetical protein
MKTLYQSNDGKIFNDCDACYNYERWKKQRGLPNFIQNSFLYDKNGKLITQENFLNCQGNVDIRYADIRTEKDFDWLDTMIGEESSLPDDIGLWYYDPELEGGIWIEYEELKDKYETVTKVFSQNKKEG